MRQPTELLTFRHHPSQYILASLNPGVKRKQGKPLSDELKPALKGQYYTLHLLMGGINGLQKWAKLVKLLD
jgi:hypothetical protein